MNGVPAGWEVVIGLETHAQLSTASKIFSGSKTTYGAAPNTQANAVDMALPGTLPVLNRGAVEAAIQFGLAIGATIAPRSVFARKNYFYPDLPKGYQISQFELPVVVGGTIPIVVDGVEKPVQLTRAHLEEDAGKSLHEGLDSMGVSGIDLNRAGTPLLEIVTEPVMRSAQEAVAYAKALHGIVTWIGICDGNMQEGSFRCDANVSVRRAGDPKLGTRCEIKNVNSFRFLERAIEFEIRRQIELIEDGGRVVQETRLYDADRDETRSMRSKEDSMDYRYFPDPDLLPLVISAAQIEAIKATMPELQKATETRFMHEYKLSEYDAHVLTQSKALANYFEACVNEGGQPKRVANWIAGPLSALLNGDDELSIKNIHVAPAQLAQILIAREKELISQKGALELFEVIFLAEDESARNSSVEALIKERGLEQISDSAAIEKIIDEVLAANQKSVGEFKSGKEKAFQSLVGQVMKASTGKANPAQVNALLTAKLS